MSAALGELVVTGVQKFGPPHALCYYSAEPVFASSQGNIATVQNSGHWPTIPEKVDGVFFHGTGIEYPTHMVYPTHVRVSKQIEHLVFFSFYHAPKNTCLTRKLVVKYSHVDINNNMNLQYPSQVCFRRSSRNTIPRAMVFHVFELNYIIYEYILHNYFYTIVPLITTSMAQGLLDSCTNVPILKTSLQYITTL